MVYGAERDGEPFAVKVLSGASANPDVLAKRFEREATCSAQSSNTRVLFESRRLASKGMTSYLVMERLTGETLEARLQREALSPKEIFFIMRRTLAAVAHAHKSGVVHRDLKPANVFLTKSHDGTMDVCVLDFGLAKFLCHDEEDAEGDADP